MFLNILHETVTWTSNFDSVILNKIAKVFPTIYTYKTLIYIRPCSKRTFPRVTKDIHQNKNISCKYHTF